MKTFTPTVINLHGTEPKAQIGAINHRNHLDSVRRSENKVLFVFLSLCVELQSNPTDAFFKKVGELFIPVFYAAL